ncbi:unnamed protein product [Peronospora belbahrii]|uniref:RING-type domain-containing protein n=1 Tax=Peronospora belbahrii TaxID=622444 RepID=A0AAU9KK76_9STRA|nr:unnamed protein product [Peronospora belbahrii]CAH0521992.1 unnamed protein product [Peronospora belbahrii]
MVSSRQGRKFSASVCPQLPTYVRLLESLQLTLQSSTRDRKHPLFILHVQCRNNSSTAGAWWSLPLPFEAFEMLHHQLTLGLQHGHFCSAGCPWLFSFLSTGFPKKHIFQRNSSPRIIEARRQKLLLLLTRTLDFLVNRRNHTCNIVTTNVVKLFAEFLYGKEAVAQYVSKLEATSLTNIIQHCSSGVLSGDEKFGDSSLNDNNGQLRDTICGVCSKPVDCQVNSNIGFNFVNAERLRESSVYLTTLQCGHRFHDECIVPVLNEMLRCPTCYHVEIQ